MARAVADCEVPTISGVGHETDFTICDFVADLRAPTPSAAAEIVIRTRSEICAQVDHMARRVRHVVEARVRNYRHELRHLSSSDRLGIVVRRVAMARERLERRRVLLYRLLDARARTLRRRLSACDEPLARFPVRIARDRERLRATMTTLQAVSPLSVLSRLRDRLLPHQAWPQADPRLVAGEGGRADRGAAQAGAAGGDRRPAYAGRGERLAGQRERYNRPSHGRRPPPNEFGRPSRTSRKIVQRLESEELPLDESLQLFEEGIRLSRFCHQRLEEVEKKIELILADAKGQPITEPFEEDELPDEEEEGE